MKILLFFFVFIENSNLEVARILYVTKKKPNFNPDELVLTKKQILEFCDRVLEKWNKKPVKNANNILAMNAVKTSIVWTDDESLKAIWSEILNWTFELLYENALSGGENSEWSHVMKKLKNAK